MRRDNLTNQRIDLVHSIYKLLWSFWKTKYFCIIVLHDCVLNQQHPPPKAVTAFIVLCVLSEAQVIISYMKMIIFSGFSYILSDI